MAAGEEVALFPTPTADDAKGAKFHTGGNPMLGQVARTLPPTPAVTKMQAAHGNGNGHGKSLSIEAQRLLPTPNTMDGLPARSDEALARAREVGGCANLKDVREQEWGDYAAAIARWETVLGRPAPPPTMTSAKGNPQLSPRFVEWMMGLPAGWVTDVPGITRNEALRALGNGVCPPQCAAALRLMLGQEDAA